MQWFDRTKPQKIAFGSANELGVILAHYGEFEASQRTLEHSLSITPSTECWHNLAVVREKMGEPAVDKQSREHDVHSKKATRVPSMPVHRVRPDVFRKAMPPAGPVVASCYEAPRGNIAPER